MPLNKGYLKAKRTVESDECYTPEYAILPLLKYIPINMKIWCPFDDYSSNYVKIFKNNNYNVQYSHINMGNEYCFFKYEPTDYDIIVSNPPFSKNDDVIKRLYELNKPFIMLFPIQTLQGVTRYDYLKNGCQIIIFDKRIGFYQNNHLTEGTSFASIYICKDILPRDIIFEKLNK